LLEISGSYSNIISDSYVFHYGNELVSRTGNKEIRHFVTTNFDQKYPFAANLECMSEMCGTRLAANTGRKKLPFWHHRTTLSGCIFTTEARIDNRKKLVKQQYILHMSSYYGELRPSNG